MFVCGCHAFGRSSVCCFVCLIECFYVCECGWLVVCLCVCVCLCMCVCVFVREFDYLI